MHLLLHTCCADCALKFLECKKSLDTGNITLYFSNSNIHPRTEWQARLEAVQKIAEEKGIDLIVENWSPREWFEKASSKFETQKTKNKRRCEFCWFYRLSMTAQKAKSLGYDSFSTTLLTSHYQDRDKIEEIGKKIGGDSLKFISLKGKCPDVHTGGFYKQNYCGCIYSLKERYEGKFCNEQ